MFQRVVLLMSILTILRIPALAARPGARAALAAANAADGRFVLSRLTLARLGASEGHIEAARQQIGSVLAGDPDNVPARLMLTELDDFTGDTTAAVQHYRKVLQADRDNVVALNNLAYRLNSDAKHREEALRMAERAQQQAPENGAVADTLGWIHYSMGQPSTAPSYFEFETQLKPGAAPVAPKLTGSAAARE